MNDLEKIKVACYCRVSTKNESQTSSIENQQKFFYDYIATNQQYELYKLYTDEGISAKSTKKRKAFLDMVNDAKNGCFHKILVKDVSRLARNVVDLLETIRELRQYHVKVEFITYNMETLGNSEFVLTVLAAIAQEESQNISVKVKFGKKMAAKKGAVPSVVYGYESGAEKYELNIKKEEACIVKKIFELYTEKQFGPYQIAKQLTEEKIPTKKRAENGWTAQTVDRILKNKLYTGNICNGKTEVQDYITGETKKYEEDQWIMTERPELRILSDSLFERAQTIRQSRQIQNNTICRTCRSNRHILSNLISCDVSHHSFRRKHKKGSDYAYWACSKRDKMGVMGCNNCCIVYEKQFNSLIFQFLNDILGQKNNLLPIYKKILIRKLAEKQKAIASKESLLTEKNHLLQYKEKLITLYLSNVIDQLYLNYKLYPIETRIKEIKYNIAQLDHDISVDLQHCCELFEHMIHKNVDEFLNNIFLKTIFSEFIVSIDGSITAYLAIDEKNLLKIPFAMITDV